MKICVITGLYPPYRTGGAERVAVAAAQEFAFAGHDVFVIAASPFSGFKSFFPNKKIENKIAVYRFFPLNIFFYGDIGNFSFVTRCIWHFLDILNLHAAISIIKIIKMERPQAVFTHNIKGFGLITVFLLRIVKRRLGFKWVHTTHDVQLVIPSGQLFYGQKETLIDRFFSFFSRMAYGSPDAVVSPSKWLLDFYSEREFFPKSIRKVILNPVKKCSMLHAAGSIQNSFLYLGQLEEHKGILFLIDAFKQFLKKYNSTLTIVGEGLLLEEVKQKVKGTPEIKVLEPVPHDRLGSIISMYNATIVPSTVYENAPNVIIESLNCGVPVIASKIGGIPELVENGVNGWLFEPGNTESLMSAMDKAVTSPLSAITPKPQLDYVAEILLLIS